MLNPGTPLAFFEPVVDLLDIVLVMSVNPGFGGQKFIDSQLGRIAELRRMIDASGREIRLEVDGGIDPRTAPLCIAAGCRYLRGGNSDFRNRRLSGGD